MAKFKKGDRVRCITPTPNGCLKGHIGTLIRDPEGDLSGGNIYLDTFKHCAGLGDYFELLTEYTPITPKVGERYRVLKHMEDYGYEGWGEYIVGDVTTLESIEKEFSWFGKTETSNTHVGVVKNKYLTTEYLELVEKKTETGTPFRAAYLSEIHYAPFDMSGTIRQIAEYSAPHYTNTQPIKKTIIQKTMNAFKKALLSADTKTLIKAVYMDDETLELTSKGQQALNFIVYEKYQKELVAAADADIKEAEAKKK